MTGQSFAVLLRCDAGGDYGLGHAARCLTLARAFATAGGAPQFIVQPGSAEGREFIEAQGMPVAVSPGRAGEADDAAFIAARVSECGPRVVLILDSRDIPAVRGADYCGRAVTLVIDDQEPRDIQSDFLLNYNPWIEPQAYPSVAGRELLLGLDYNLVAEDYFRNGEEAKEGAPRVLITMGGQDPHNDTLRIVETCGDLLAAHDVDVVVGPSHPDPASVTLAIARHLPRGRLHRAPKGLAALVKQAGLILTAGGTACYEIAAARVPMAALPVEPHQIPLVDSLGRLGALLRLDGEAGRIDRSVVSRLLQDATLRVRLVARQRTLIGAPGAPRVIARVSQALAAR
jgi:spore coat polysaccharide biosynthesis predicted glycosyltransferase SpsG